VVDGSGLENRQGESPRGFESHPLRHDTYSRQTSRASLHTRLTILRRFERRSTARAKRYLNAKPISRSQGAALDNPTPSAN
jgi:hypothetical protein